MSYPVIGALIFVLGVAFNAGSLVLLLGLTRRDVNGLGKKYARMLAFHLRCIAEEIEIEKAIAKAKLMHLADLIEPK